MNPAAPAWGVKSVSLFFQEKRGSTNEDVILAIKRSSPNLATCSTQK